MGIFEGIWQDVAILDDVYVSFFEPKLKRSTDFKLSHLTEVGSHLEFEFEVEVVEALFFLLFGKLGLYCLFTPSGDAKKDSNLDLEVFEY